MVYAKRQRFPFGFRLPTRGSSVLRAPFVPPVQTWLRQRVWVSLKVSLGSAVRRKQLCSGDTSSSAEERLGAGTPEVHHPHASHDLRAGRGADLLVAKTPLGLGPFVSLELSCALSAEKCNWGSGIWNGESMDISFPLPPSSRWNCGVGREEPLLGSMNLWQIHHVAKSKTNA